MADAPYLPGPSVSVERRPTVGYAMALSAGMLFAVNGTVSKVILSSGLGSLRLTEARCLGALIGLAAVLALFRRETLRADRRELVLLAVFGVFGVALVQLFYFLAIERLDIGISLVIQYLGPLLVALWARYVMKERVRPRVWIALVLALGGLSLVVDLWGGVSLDGLGVAFSLLSAVTFAAYLLLAERAVAGRDALSLLLYGFLFASVFWAIAQPWWSFPGAIPGRDVSLHGNLADLHLPVWSLMLWMVALGTIVPFLLIVGSLRHLPATRVGLVAMIEPVVATLVAFAWLDERLSAEQIVGGAIVLAGILLAQSAR